MSLTGRQPVETIDSFACAEGDDLRIVLHLPESGATSADSLPVRLRRKGESVVASGVVRRSGDGIVLDVRFPRGEISPGVWLIALLPEGQEAVGVQARLLSSLQQPIALLPGPTPATEMAPPRRRRPSAPPAAGAGDGRLAVRLLDAGLSALPAERAARYRATLKRLVRR